MATLPEPTLSVVVVIVSDTTEPRTDVSHLAGCLEALAGQVDAPPLEVIVPYHRLTEGVAELSQRFPAVRFHLANDIKTLGDLGGSHEHHDELRARGLALARGEIVGLLEDHARPDRHWCAGMVRAHRRGGFAGIGGAIENGIDRPLNWAVYFCDFGRYQNPLPEGASPFASDANIAYKRAALEAVRPVWQEIYQETAVNAALSGRGDTLGLTPHAVVYQHRTGLRLIGALRERFIWGRSYAATRGRLVGRVRRVMYAALSPVLPGVLLWRMARNVVRKRRCVGAFLKALPLTSLLTVSWSVGELAGYVTGQATRSGTPVADAVQRSRVTAGRI
jgi:hypothetical protein